MKYTISVLSILAAAGIFFSACTPDKYEPVGEPFNKVDGVKGQWKISSLVQIDEIALARELPLTQMNITGFFNFSNYRITFNVDEANNPTTFEIQNPDLAPNFVVTSGNWNFDNVDFPSQIYLIRPSVDTTKVDLVATPRSYFPLKFKFTRHALIDTKKEKIMSYHYTFERVTP